MTHPISRRKLTRRLGLASGAALVTPSLTRAGPRLTPAQTAGPFYPVHEAADLDADLTRIAGVPGQAEGEVILVTGQVTDPDGRTMAGALVDVWQANHHGKYIHPRDRNPAPLDPSFQGWAKVRTRTDGSYTFKTIMPAPYPLGVFSQEGVRCRHIHFKVSHPELHALTTQMYFAGDPLIEDDVVMADTPEAERNRLIAHATEDAATGLPLYRFDLVLDMA